MNNRVSKNKYSDIQNAKTRVRDLQEVNRHHEKKKKKRNEKRYAKHSK